MAAPSCVTASDRPRRAVPPAIGLRPLSSPAPAPAKAASSPSSHFSGSRTKTAAAEKHSSSPWRTPGRPYSHREARPQAAQAISAAGRRSRFLPRPAARPVTHQISDAWGLRPSTRSTQAPKAVPTHTPAAGPPKAPAHSTRNTAPSPAGDQPPHTVTGSNVKMPPRAAVSLPHRARGERLSRASRSIRAKPRHRVHSHSSSKTARTPPAAATTPLVNSSARAAQPGKNTLFRPRAVPSSTMRQVRVTITAAPHTSPARPNVR